MSEKPDTPDPSPNEPSVTGNLPNPWLIGFAAGSLAFFMTQMFEHDGKMTGFGTLALMACFGIMAFVAWQRGRS